MENEYNVEETKFGTETTHPAYGTIMFNVLKIDLATELWMAAKM